MTEWVITSSILILLIVLLRLFLRKKIAARVQYALWLAVLVRLLLPVTLMDSRVSILNLVPEYGAIHTAEDTDAGTAAGTEEEIGTEETETEHNIRAYDADSADQILQAKVQQADGKDTAHYKNQVSEVMNTEISDSEMQTFDGEGSRMKKSMEQRAAVRRWVLCSEAAGRNEDKDVFVLAGSGLIDNFRYILRNFDQSRMENILGIIWIVGMVICSGSILLSNMVFYRRVRRSSRKLDTEWPEELHGSLFNRRNRGISVYQSGFLNTPCMLGILCPAIYVTEEAMQDKGTLYYVISHEKTHFVHGDHIWALLRTICLCIHWYNPLVWMAARLSKQDAELACDEGTLAYLGERERIPYGRALLAMSAGRDFGQHMGITNLATTMWGGKKQLKERLQFIAKKPKMAVGAFILAVLAAIAAVGLTFTGRKPVSVQDGQIQEKIQGNLSQSETIQGNLLQEDMDDGAEGGQNAAGQKPSEADTENQIETLTEKLQQEVQIETITEKLQQEVLNERVQALDYMGYTGHPDEYEQRAYDTDLVDCDFQDGNIIVEDLNFDGKEDFCLQGAAEGDHIPYDCYLWDEQLQKFVYGFTLQDVKVDREKEQLIYTVGDSDTESVTRYCSYDEAGRLSLVREVRENKAPDAVLTSVDLCYVEEPYSIPAFEIYDGSYDNIDVGYWAEEALKELYQWTGMEGLKESKYYFTVTEYGDYYFAKTEEDIRASRDFYSRCYGEEAGFEHCIPSLYIAYADDVWYSDVKQNGWPDGYRNMSDEELCSWYLENAAIAREEKVKSIMETFEGNFVAEMESGHFYEMTYSSGKRLISSVYGPYDGFPQH